MKLFCLTFVTVVLFCIFPNLPLWCQGTQADLREEYAKLVLQSYGQDQELVNGKQYYNIHLLSSGNPYLLGGPTHKGSVTINGKQYEDIRLRYDIYYQQLEVDYQTINGANNEVILVSDRLDEFTVGELLFRRIVNNEGQGQFYQEIGDGKLVVYVSWEKKLVPVSGDSQILEYFTSAKRSYLVQLDGTDHTFKNRKQFIKLLPEVLQKDVKKLMKSYNINLSNASPAQLTVLMEAVSDYTNDE